MSRAQLALHVRGVDAAVRCDATTTETWVHDPDGAPWEWYATTRDADQMAGTVVGTDPGAYGAPRPEPVAIGTRAGAKGCCR